MTEESISEKLKNSSSEITELRQYLTFTVSNEEYGIELMKIREIKGWSDTTKLPNSPKYMKGVINLRGVVIPIFDLKDRFNIGTTEPTDKNVVIILAVGEELIGILVDSVSDILSVEPNQVRPAPHIETKIDDDYINGLISVEDKMVVVLDVDKVFDSETLRNAEELTNNR